MIGDPPSVRVLGASVKAASSACELIQLSSKRNKDTLALEVYNRDEASVICQRKDDAGKQQILRGYFHPPDHLSSLFVTIVESDFIALAVE